MLIWHLESIESNELSKFLSVSLSSSYVSSSYRALSQDIEITNNGIEVLVLQSDKNSEK